MKKTNWILKQNEISNLKKTKLINGYIGLQSLQSGYLILPQIDILKKFLYPISKNKYFRSNLIYLCFKIFITRIITQKPIQSRIGRGKGTSTHWYCRIYKNHLKFNIKKKIPLFLILFTETILFHFK